MIISYGVLVVGFLVEGGPSLPLWDCKHGSSYP